MTTPGELDQASHTDATLTPDKAHGNEPAACASGGRQLETLITVRRHLLAGLPVDRDAADVGHEHPRLSRHVSPDVPVPRVCHHGGLSDLGNVLHP